MKVKISGQDRFAFFPHKLPFCSRGVFFIISFSTNVFPLKLPLGFLFLFSQASAPVLFIGHCNSLESSGIYRPEDQDFVWSVGSYQSSPWSWRCEPPWLLFWPSATPQCWFQAEVLAQRLPVGSEVEAPRPPFSRSYVCLLLVTLVPLVYFGDLFACSCPLSHVVPSLTPSDVKLLTLG